MKKLLIILLFLIGLVGYSQSTYYVATDGDNEGTGAIGDPWLTFQYAVSIADDGDTVFFRGGTYPMASNVNFPRDGSTGAGNWIYFYNYPDEVPIFDWIDYAYAGTRVGFYMYQRDYIEIKGLTIKNVKEYADGNTAVGIHCHTCTNINFIEVTSCYNGGHGFNIYLSDEIYVRNCDSHHNADVLHTPSGETADGFTIYNDPDQTTYLIGCRGWSNSDDGVDTGDGGTVYCIGCWMFDNGRLVSGDGNGFKYGLRSSDPTTGVTKFFYNCLAAYGGGAGFVNNDAGIERMSSEVFNCTSYKNAFGILIYNSSSTDVMELERYYKNNIVYDNTNDVAIADGAVYTHEYNSWDDPPDVTIANTTFVSVDSTGLSGARQDNGNLPVLTFLHLVDEVANGAGIGVGLTYDCDSLYHNDPPDLGLFAYDGAEPAPPTLPQVTTTLTSYASVRAIIAGNVTDDGGGTVSARGICFDTSINPTITDNIVPSGSGTGAFSCTLILEPSTTYYARAYATGSVAGTGYGTNIQIDTPPSSPVFDGVIITDGSGNIIIE